MPARFTLEDANNKFAANPHRHGGVFKIVGPFAGYRTVNTLQCEAGHTWQGIPKAIMAEGRGCRACYAAKGDFRHNVRDPKDVKAELEALWPNVSIVGGYSATYKKADLRCSVCSHTWSSTVYQLLRANRRYGCPKCAHSASNDKKSRSLTEFEAALLAKHGGQIRLLEGGFSRAKDQMNFRCTRCRLDFTKTGEDVLRGRDCPSCAASKSYRHKEYKLGRRSVFVQGYEHFVLDFLTKELKIRKSLINVFSEGKVPRISYKHEGVESEHRPDLLADGVIYEVKSYYTLGLNKPHLLSRNKSKAKAALKQGLDYRVALASGTGKVIVLPETWHRLSVTRLTRIAHDAGIYLWQRKNE